MLIVGSVLAGALVMWRLPGRLIDPVQLDYVSAFDDAAAGSILVVAAFDAGSVAVIDSCSHEWRGTSLVIELRSKVLVSRDGRTTRIAAFRVPYTGGTSPASVELRGGAADVTVPVSPMPAGFMPLTPVIDSLPR